jgi:hypothetical protein
MNVAMDDRGGRRLALLALLAVTGILFIDLCAAVFGCGCRSLWNGAAGGCNVHAPAPPHCPWCVHPFAGGAVAFVSIVAVQTWTILRPGRLPLALRAALALAVAPALGGLAGAIHGFLWEYWGP